MKTVIKNPYWKLLLEITTKNYYRKSLLKLFFKTTTNF
jgi:hypothetical protein